LFNAKWTSKSFAFEHQLFQNNVNLIVDLKSPNIVALIFYINWVAIFIIQYAL